MYIVIVTFEQPDHAEAVETAVRGLLDRLVSRQPGFRRARLHRGTGPSAGRVVNYMEWESAEAFQAFRAAHGPEVTEAVGRYEPGFAFYEVAHAVGDWAPAAAG